MNPIQKFIWLLVVVAGVATAAAGIRVLTNPPPEFAWNRRLQVPPHLAGKIWIGAVADDDCKGVCRQTLDALDNVKQTTVPPVEVAVLRTRVSGLVYGSSQGAAESEKRALEESASQIEELYSHVGPPMEDPSSGEVVLNRISRLWDWKLTAEDGQPFGQSDLAGKIWIADFIFTRCSSACPAMCKGMEEIIGKLPNDPRLQFVSFSVDPDYDKPEVLREYRKLWKEDSRWRFATGMWVYKLAYEGFKVEEARPNPEPTPGNQFFHTQRIYLVDGEGQVRGHFLYDYEEPSTLPAMADAITRSARALLETPDKVVDHVHDRRLFLVDAQGALRGVYPSTDAVAAARDARRLALTPPKLVSVRSLPRLNAVLNFTSFLFLSAGLAFILNRKIGAHKAAMTAALVTSLVFLASYLTYHFQAGSVKYAGTGWMRSAYFAILLSHTILAAIVAPMALVTVVRAWRGSFDRHVAIARWTLPVWMYVSLTGILVYLMLYQIT